MFKRVLHTFLFAALLGLAACESENESRVRKLTEAQVEQEQQSLNERIQKMEKTLKERHELFQTYTGTFEGDVGDVSMPFRIKILSALNLPLYQGTHQRTLPEVESDLQQLGLNLQILVYDPKFPMNAVGCIFEGVKPEHEDKEISIIKNSCPNTFKIQISHNAYEGVLQPSTSIEEMKFTAQRRSRQ